MCVNNIQENWPQHPLARLSLAINRHPKTRKSLRPERYHAVSMVGLSRICCNDLVKAWVSRCPRATVVGVEKRAPRVTPGSESVSDWPYRRNEQDGGAPLWQSGGPSLRSGDEKRCVPRQRGPWNTAGSVGRIGSGAVNWRRRGRRGSLVGELNLPPQKYFHGLQCTVGLEEGVMIQDFVHTLESF